jgi:ATP-dependent helicase/nuclease subunit A
MRIPVDQADRDRIVRDLDTNLLVEAGAGSGKTKSLVDRVLAHVDRGTPLERIAAVTFTRKAAAELRERIEVELEKATRAAEAGSERRDRLERARAQLDRAFIGTIHAFAARLLREYPLDAGIDPGFEEIAEEEWPGVRQDFWNRWLDQQRRSGAALLEDLRQRRIDPRALFDGFQQVVRYPDVEFPARAVPEPDCGACRAALRELIDRTGGAMPRSEPAAGWDPLQRTVRRLRRAARISNWSDTGEFCDALSGLSARAVGVTQNRWGDKAVAKALGQEWKEFLEGPVAAVQTRWREHRYHFVMAALAAAAREFERERRRTGRLGFEDLLIGSVALLRRSPSVRRALGERFRYLLVDEFQDTDPIQAELCFLLASAPEEGDDWQAVTPRAGSLFVVGDPKQSIYRFRRADIQTYELVKRRMTACGAVLGLVENFRSVKPVETLVDGYFRAAFPQSATAQQAAFAPLRTRDEADGSDGVYVYAVTPAANNKAEIVSACSEAVASWIRGRLDGGSCRPEDFLVLAPNKKWLHHYARALGRRNVPATVSGGTLDEEHELTELVVVLRALADPANAVLVAAALEGLFFGCSPADLYDAQVAGMEFVIVHAPAETESAVGRALARLHGWWLASRRCRPDQLAERILDETGILAYAASQPLGNGRAGALLRVGEVLRMTAGRGATALSSAILAIETMLEQESDDSYLLPGRSDAVRVMNLHKAKGLEARIVVLAAPVKEGEHPVTSHVRRAADGRATGGLRITRTKKQQTEVLAQPEGWTAMEAEETAFLAAEKERLLYVAATRARRELIIARLDFMQARGPAPDGCLWRPLRAEAERIGSSVTFESTAAPGRRPATRTVDAIQTRAAAADRRRAAASAAGFDVRTVTESAKGERELYAAYATAPMQGGGRAWGRAVHRAIEAMGRGRTGESLAAFVEAVVRDERLAADEAGLAMLARRLADALERIHDTETWRAVMASSARLMECPIVQATRHAGGEQVVEGVADALILDAGRCRVLDWKSDDVTDAAWSEREPVYQRQVTAYAEMVQALTSLEVSTELVRVGVG